MKKIIPNAITSANLLCGCIAVTQISEGNFIAASLLVLLGAFFDFFDGMAARLLNVGSPIGAQLDSLADMVTFGLVPAYLIFNWLNEISPSNINFIAFLIAVFSAVRLAKFNVDERQSTSFIGLPTPANALLWISIPLINWQLNNNYQLIDLSVFQLLIENKILLISLIVLFSFLLIAELPLLSLKFKTFGWKGNEYKAILILGSIIFMILLYFAAIPFILLLYIILSVLQTSFNKTNEIQS